MYKDIMCNVGIRKVCKIEHIGKVPNQKTSSLWCCSWVLFNVKGVYSNICLLPTLV